MTTIIDLGNGYGRVEGYGSKHASLAFPFSLSALGRLYREGYITRTEFYQILLDVEYNDDQARRCVAIADVTVAQWKVGLSNARSI